MVAMANNLATGRWLVERVHQMCTYQQVFLAAGAAQPTTVQDVLGVLMPVHGQVFGRMSDLQQLSNAA